jgi:HK97 family phage major capsid protein
VGPRYRAALLEGLPDLIVDGLRKGQYGTSHSFRSVHEDWDPRPKGGPHNPDKLPERTIKEAQVFEISVVTWPAYAGATVGLRSMSDEFALETLTADPARLRELVNYVEPAALPEGADESHSDESRDEPPPPATETKETPTVEYLTRDDKAARCTELKQGLQRQAVEYPGVLPEEAQKVWDSDTDELRKLEADIAAWDNRQTLLRDYASDPAKTVPAFNVPQIIKPHDDPHDVAGARAASSTDEQFHQKLRDNGMRIVEKAVIPHPRADQDGARAHVASMLDYADSPDKELAIRLAHTGSPVYRRIFTKYLNSQPMTNDEVRYAAVTTGGTTTGGYATPWVLDPTIIGIGAHTSTNPYRAACRVVSLVGTNKWEALTATEVLVAYAGEAVAPAEGGPTFAQPTYACLKASGFVTLSFEILEDRPDITSEIAVLFQQAKDTEEELRFSIGAGTTVPWGIALLSEYTTVKTVGAGVVAIADVYAMEAALPIRHRANGAWFMSRGTIRAVQGFETVGGILFNSTNGFPAVGNPQRNPTGNTGLQLLGYPVWEAPSITTTLTTPDTNPMVFCDPQSYIIVDRVGMNIEVVQNVFEHAAGSRPMLQRGVLAHWRNVARRVAVDAGRIMVIE